LGIPIIILLESCLIKKGRVKETNQNASY